MLAIGPSIVAFRRAIYHNLPANVYGCLGNARFSHVTRPRCRPAEEKEWLPAVISRRTTDAPRRAAMCRVLRSQWTYTQRILALIDSEDGSLVGV